VKLPRLLCLFLLASAVQPGVSLAKQDDGVLEHLSGPGPFIRWPSLDVRVACITRVGNDTHTVALAPWGRGSTAEFAFRPYTAPARATAEHTAKLQCSRDEQVRGYIAVAYGHYTSVQNNLFPDNLEDEQFKVKADSISVRFMGRTLNDVVDVGFGLNMFWFYGPAFDRFTRLSVEPVRVSVAPFAAIRSTARTRAFHLTVAPTFFLGKMDQDDFCNSRGCTTTPRQFSSKAETLWATTVEVDVLTLIRGD
jgi:hypothetical protein